LVKLVEFGAKEDLIREHGLILCDQGRGEGPTERILDDFFILGGAEE
jgi:hypothetical protein